ncbi:MAG TPA: DUF1223 domain-containing protein [Alphaproteobacteria bacterium]|nr:DUF1223 domain-containing protein [Alphaproteobacteria bacterium]
MAALAATLASLASPARAEAPVVVELFTSQGCSSCPPADAFLGELAEKPGIVALAFHVGYWDYIGWKDPFAKPWSVARQRGYTAALDARYLYTPEIVVDGRADLPGTERAGIDKLIAAEAKARKIPVTLAESSKDKYSVAIPAAAVKGPATVWLAVYDHKHTTAVARGENEGRTLTDYNVVRQWRAIGRYDGKALTIPFDPSAAKAAAASATAPAPDATTSQGVAVLIQADDKPGDGHGPILGAASMKLN